MLRCKSYVRCDSDEVSAARRELYVATSSKSKWKDVMQHQTNIQTINIGRVTNRFKGTGGDVVVTPL